MKQQTFDTLVNKADKAALAISSKIERGGKESVTEYAEFIESCSALLDSITEFGVMMLYLESRIDYWNSYGKLLKANDKAFYELKKTVVELK